MSAAHALYINKLLSEELPLETLGPRLRGQVRQALHSRDETLQRAILGAVLRELTRQGILQRVAASGKGGLTDFLHPASGRIFSTSPDTEKGSPADPGAPSGEPREFQGVLSAMEEAQDLRLSDLQAGDVPTILGNIIGLLQAFMPQFHLGILYHGPAGAVPNTPHVVLADSEDGAVPWQEMRPAGHAVWIPTAEELPPGLRRNLPADNSSGQGWVAAGVPILAPQDDAAWESQSEAGLLFVIAPGSWKRAPLLKVGDRLARFVATRWQYQRELNRFIHTDALTGVNNRAFFDRNFGLELERARRIHRPLSLILGDIDTFKAINDRYGHQVGDQVLQAVARKLLEALRRIDIVCRIGGEEFGLILPDTESDAARDVILRIMASPLQLNVPYADGTESLTVTLSYGLVTFPRDGADALELFRKADAMLYLSKDAGRNRCHIWDPDGQHLLLLPDSGSEKS